MELNHKLKLILLILIIIFFVLIFILLIIYTFKNQPLYYFKALSSLELDELINVNPSLKDLRHSLQLEFLEEINRQRLVNVNKENLKCFIYFSLLELQTILNEYERNDIIITNNALFLKYFNIYIKNARVRDITEKCVLRSRSFINNMPDIVYYKYKYAINYFKTKNIYKLEFQSFETYIERLGNFLANYKHVERDDKFITAFIKKNSFDIDSQALFKKTLTFIWRLGTYIVYKLSLGENVVEAISIFDKYLDHIINMCSKQTSVKKFPFGYDWFLFASYYPTIMCYKLFIDYTQKGIIDEVYIYEILKYIPKINYSKHIRRFKSNVAIMSINYIIAHLFKFKEEMYLFHDFLINIKNSNIYEEDILIQYQEPLKDQFKDGLYFDGGFIVHKNLVSYNYLTAYLYPSLFYKVMFNADSNNINRIFKALGYLVTPNRKVNPALISRYGRFNESENVLEEFIKNASALKIKYHDGFYKKYINIRNGIETKEEGIRIIESARLIIANFKTWSMQLKINSELAYGEIDIYNKEILKQISMSKIMFFDNIDIIAFKQHSLYPGVLSYRRYLDLAETFEISYGTNTFTFAKVKYTFMTFDTNTVVVYSVVSNKQTKINYEEFLLITKYGIVVGYFNIERFIDDDLFLTFETELISNYTESCILYSDNKEQPQVYNTASVKKVDQHILYYNKIKTAPSIDASVNIGNKIEIYIKFDNEFYIILDRERGIYAYRKAF